MHHKTVRLQVSKCMITLTFFVNDPKICFYYEMGSPYQKMLFYKDPGCHYSETNFNLFQFNKA